MAFFAQLAACLALLPGVVTFYAIVAGRLKVLLVVEGHVPIGGLERNDICGKGTSSHEDRKQKAGDNADADQTLLHSILTSFLTLFDWNG